MKKKHYATRLKEEIQMLNREIQSLRGKNGFGEKTRVELKYQALEDMERLVWFGGKDDGND